jgi:hypothetical protein
MATNLGAMSITRHWSDEDSYRETDRREFNQAVVEFRHGAKGRLTPGKLGPSPTRPVYCVPKPFPEFWNALERRDREFRLEPR